MPAVKAGVTGAAYRDEQSIVILAGLAVVNTEASIPPADLTGPVTRQDLAAVATEI
jgi:hypothetical protein